MPKMIPPHPGATWCDPQGQHHTAGPDGAVEIPEVQVAGLIDLGWTRAPIAQAPVVPMPFISSAKGGKDLEAKFNTLLAQLQAQGLMEKS
jgi:hypothetical protein